MLTNQSTREVNVKVIVYGPSSAGKASLLERLYSETPAEQKGLMITLTHLDKTVFFDLRRPGFGELDGFYLRLHFYTISGEVRWANSWRLLLRGADSLIVLIDAQEERLQASIDARNALEQYLSEQDRVLSDIPHVTAVTKTDMPNSASSHVLASVIGDLGVSAAHLDPRRGAGVDLLLDHLLGEIRSAFDLGRLEEWQLPRNDEVALEPGPERDAGRRWWQFWR